MKILLTALNAKYIHSNPAVYSLRAYAGQEIKEHIEIAEYTINQYTEEILADIYKRQPDVIAVSCYIWNISQVRELITELSKILPQVPIWVGGPEVSYDAEGFLKMMPQVRGVMTGEGEETFRELCREYLTVTSKERSFAQIRGLVYREESQSEDVWIHTGVRDLLNMDDMPFLYGDLADFENRIIYYESSRGCPFSCSYCLSSIDKTVRFRDIRLVEKELQFFLDHKVPQVKFVDRTFNCSHTHAMAVWTYLKEHDNGVTNFHFEIAADILNQEELELLGSMRPLLVQLEIGVQSTFTKTIKEIHRTMDLDKLSTIVERIRQGRNIHQHLDLIAGLPYEDLAAFSRSFDQVYALRPQQLQLGFLKVLKGSNMYRMAPEYGIAYTTNPPYEVLFTRWISYEEIRLLKNIEEMVELYYNSMQFVHILEALEQKFSSPFQLYQALGEYYQAYNKSGSSGQDRVMVASSRIRRYEIILEFGVSECGIERQKMTELVLCDLYLRENLKSRPSFAPEAYREEEREAVRQFYQEEAVTHRYLKGYEGYDYRQLMKMTHLEVFRFQWKEARLFDYRNRDPLTRDAAVFLVTL